jgi:uncharacterized protein YfbU (UPF0304 family)
MEINRKERLNREERLNFINQFLILEKLDPENSEKYEQYREILENGYTEEYSRIFEHIQDEMTEKDCTEVYDILCMYETMIYSCKKNNLDISKEEVQFQGFDQNNEHRQLGYAGYCAKYFRRVKAEPELVERIYDSHSQNLPMYKRMLDVWKTFPPSPSLSEDQIRQILDARIFR